MSLFGKQPTELGDLQSLYAISETASQAQDLPTLWGPLLDKVLAALRVDAGTLMILEGDFLVRKAARGLGEQIMREPPIPSRDGGISWGVVLGRKPAIVSNLSSEKVASKNLAQQGFQSMVAVPMMVRDQVVGVMSIFSRQKRVFSEENVHFFTIIANQAALAIISLRSAQILRENRRRLAELEALNQISKSLTNLFDFEETLYSIVASITKMLRADKGVLVLYDHADHLLKAAGPAYGLTAKQVQDFRTRDDEGVGGEAFCKGVPILMAKIDGATSEILKRANIGKVKSVLAAPLKVKSQTLGVILVFSERENNFYTEDLRLFTILSAQAAVVVNSLSMYRQIAQERKKDEVLLSSMGEGVLAIDTQQKIIHLNRAGEKITGFLAEELLGKTLAETLGFYDKKGQGVPVANSPISKVLAGGQIETSRDFYLKKRHGTLFPAYLSVAAIYDVENQIAGAIVVFRDITHEEELERMKQEILSLATHELRGPITGIKGYLSMVVEGDTGPVGEDTKETLQEVLKINQRLADLVDDLLNVSRIEQGRISMRFESVNMGELIERAIKDYEPLAREKKLVITYAKQGIPPVKADATRLFQVITNLLSNAIKYTFKGSIKIDTFVQGKEVVFEITDSGIGIPTAAQRRLFEKFYRVKSTATREVTGTGLGLWISKALVTMMGGKIWFASSEGKGATFYFSVPLAN